MPAIAPRGRCRNRRAVAEINMVPFIDVMLVLLIIFMVTAPLISPSVIQLPTVGKAAQAPERVIQVLIDAEGAIQIRDANTTLRTTLAEVAPQVQALQRQGDSSDSAAATTPVVIGADKAVRYEAVVKVMDALQRAGVSRVGLSVQTAR